MNGTVNSGSLLFFLMKKFLFGRVDQILAERAAEIEVAKELAEQIRLESQAKIDDYNAACLSDCSA